MASYFWDAVRKAAATFGDAFNGRATTAAIRNATPTQRAFAVGATPGQPVTNKWEELAHDTSWNYIGIHTVAKQWAQADWVAYDESETRQPVRKSHAADAPSAQWTPVPDHPALKLLNRPNPMMSRMKFMYIVGSHLRLTGGWLILEIRSKITGKPIELWPLPRAWTTWMPPTQECPLGEFQVLNPRGMTGYWGNNPLASGFRVDVRECSVSGWPHPMNPGEQISPLSACSRIIDIIEQTDATVWSSLYQAVHNGLILILDPNAGPTDEPAIKQLSEAYRSTKGGPGNAGKAAAMVGVKSIERPSIPLSELMAVEVRNQNKDFGLGIQGVPGVATGIRSEVGSYSGDAATFNGFAELGIQPDIDLFGAEMTMRWQRYWGENFRLEGHAKRIDDPIIDLQRIEKLQAAYETGLAKGNEVRAAMKLPPLPELDELKAPEPQPGAIGPDGQPIPGAPGQDQSDEFDLSLDDELDLEPEPADEQGGGWKRPELSRAGGRSFSSNGKH